MFNHTVRGTGASYLLIQHNVQLLRCVFCHILDMCWGCLLLQQCQNGPCYEEPFRAVWSIRRGPVTSGNAASQCGVRG